MSMLERIAPGDLDALHAVENALGARVRAVAAAHDASIVHRDLKPENIVVGGRDTDGSAGTKVLDFGISRSSNLEEAPLTREGAFLGTPAYVAPEQLCDPRAADARSDVYSMGVVLYEGLTGVQPFAADTLSGLARRILAGCPTPVRALRSDVPPMLAEIVHRAMAREPGRRPQSMRALLDALEHWRAEQELEVALGAAQHTHVPAAPTSQTRASAFVQYLHARAPLLPARGPLSPVRGH
jgi:serine/threonine-protein kinase